MQTEVIRIDDVRVQSKVLKRAGEILRSGGLVAFPTETVYGLGGDAFNPSSSKKIYAAKGRPSDNPLIVHIAEMSALDRLSNDIPDKLFVLAESFWPGPLTMIIKKLPDLPDETTGGLDTVAIRMPDHPVALALIRAGGGYIAAPSANASGRPSPTLASHVAEDLNGRIDMIIDGGEVGIGIESTIVDLSGEVPTILRPGYVTAEMLERVIGHVDTDPTLMKKTEGGRPKAPGMRYRHYAPKGEVIPVRGSADRVFTYITEGLAKAKLEGRKTGVFCSADNADRYDADVVRSAGALDDAEAAAHVFYTTLRDMDDEDVDIIYVENFTDLGFGEALWNRLLKSAGSKWEEA